MNVFEVFGVAFLVLVIANLVSMIWAIKNARCIETPNLTNEQET